MVKILKEPRTYISLQDCKYGWLYKVWSRNLTLGVYREDKKGFVGIREKFGEEYLFVEFHWDTGPPFGTVKPLKLLEQCPIQNLDEYNISHDGRVEMNMHLFEWLKQRTKNHQQRTNNNEPRTILWLHSAKK